jgi:hypothetical protein
MPSIDPTKKIQVSLDFESPQVVVFRLWYQEPGESNWLLFGSGTDSDHTTDSSHSFKIGPLKNGSTISYFFLFTGNPCSSFKADINVRQETTSIAIIPIAGLTDTDGVKVVQGKVALS